MSQAKRTVKAEKDNAFINDILDYYSEKYNLSKAHFFNSIDADKLDYKLEQFKITKEKIDDEMEAININENLSTTTLDTIIKAINNLIATAEKEKIENDKIKNKTEQKKKNNNDKTTNLLNENHPANKKIPAKNSIIIDNNINVKYNTSIIYNIGDNDMEREFNKMNPAFN